MERVIKNLVEYDKRGRRLVEEAEEERRSVLAHMDDYKKELAKQYHEREQEKVEQFRQQAQVEKEEALAAARALYAETDYDAETIAKKALKIASEICVFTNDNIRCETVGRKAEEISENPPKKSRAKKADEKKEDK